MSELIERYEFRAAKANILLEAIAGSGRQFFKHNGRVSRFEVDARGRVWFIDKYREARLYCHGRHALTSWRFSEGGTLRSLCLALVGYIQTGKPLGGQFGPWPEWICDGDPWGYGVLNMESLRDEARALGILPLIPRLEAGRLALPKGGS